MTGDKNLLMDAPLSPSHLKHIIFPDKGKSQVLGLGFRRGVLYIVDFSTGPQPATRLLAKASEGWLWHQRLGHAGMRNLHTLAKKKHVIGIENVKFLKDHLCGACEAGKMTKAKHPVKTIMTTT